MYRMFYVSTKLYPSIDLDIIWNGVVVNAHSLTWSHCWFKVVRSDGKCTIKNGDGSPDWPFTAKRSYCVVDLAWHQTDMKHYELFHYS